MKMVVFTCLAFSLLGGCRSGVDLPAEAWVIRNGTVIDGTGSPPVPDGVVIIVGERILAVGPASDFRIPDETVVLDARGGTIIPGIINAHVHHAASADLRHRFLLEGVTSVCDLGSAQEEMDEFLETDSEAGPAARGFRAGQIVTAPGGYPDGLYETEINYEVANPEQGRVGVRDLSRRGVDFLKIALDPTWNVADPLPVMGRETVQAISEEAHVHGLMVRTHLIQHPQMQLAVDANVDVVEHLAMPSWPSREEELRLMASSDPVGLFFQRWAPEYQLLLERMAVQGVAMVPTVSALVGSLYATEDATPRQSWVARVVMDIPRRLQEAGGVVAVGNDFNGRSMRERLPLLEMQMLLDAGFSPMEVIVAATRNSALVCGQGDELGTLEAGRLADLLILGGDPLRDLVGSLRRLEAVFRGGVIVQPGA